MSGSNSGLATYNPAGFGGFASTPEGESILMARRFNPYAYMQQDNTAPAAEPGLAGGGMAGVKRRRKKRRLRLDEGGDAGNDSSEGGGGGGGGTEGNGQDNGTGNNGLGGVGGGFGFGNANDSPGGAAMDSLGGGIGAGAMGAAGSGIGVGGGMGYGNANASPGGAAVDALGGSGAGYGGAMGQTGGAGYGSSVGVGSGVAMDVGNSVPAVAIAPAKAQQLEPSLAQAAVSGALGAAKGGLSATGLGAIGSLAGMAGINASGISNALGFGQMSPEASKGASVMGTIGGAVGTAFGGPIGGIAGAALGSALGGYAGAHGATNPDPGTAYGRNSSEADSNPSGGGDSTSVNGAGLMSLIRQIDAQLNGERGHELSDANPHASGGMVDGNAGPAGGQRFARGSGLIHGSSDGRADAVVTTVPRGGYVLPADVVSGLGEGNTLSGAKKVATLLPRQAPAYAAGGHVPVRLSAGEYYIHPAHVAALGHGNLKAGSDKLDEMVGHVRRINARQVQALPPPR